MRRPFVLLSIGVALAAGPAGAARAKSNRIMHVVAPIPRVAAPAHPHVNVIVRFGTTPDGYVPDPSTFRARLGRHDITSRFRPIVDDGATVGMRTELLPPAIKLSRRPVNHLRFEIRSLPRTGKGPKIVRDVDKVRFRAAEAENHPPVAAIALPDEVIVPETPLQFDGSASHDAELDDLQYEWNFGDHQTSTEVSPTHRFAAGLGEVMVQLTVREVTDPNTSGTDSGQMIECPPVDAGRTPGGLRVDAAQALEFNSVPPGTSAVRTFTIRNTDVTPTSQLKVAFRLHTPEFTLSPPTLDLAAGASGNVDLTFAPTAEGHRSADVVVIASGANRCALHLASHGYGGTGAGTGPTLVGTPLYFDKITGGIGGILPNGVHVDVDAQIGSCQTPNNGIGTTDWCVADADCAVNGGTCTGAPVTFEPIDMCSDGAGNLFLLSDEGTYTDPNAGDNDLGASIMRLNLDDNGGRTGARILARVNSGSTQITCDQQPGGRLYFSEFRNVDLGPECFRSEQEALVPIRRATGIKEPALLARLDAAEELDACNDDIDELADLEVSADGTTTYASFSEGGLYQVRPQFVPIADIRATFRLHPAGDIVYVEPDSRGASGLLNVYRISPQQALNTGPVKIAELSPCAVVKLPTNRLGGIGALGIAEQGFAVAPASNGSRDGMLLVSIATSGGLADHPPSLGLPLRVSGLAAVSMPAGTTACDVVGFVSLDLADQLTF